MRSSRALLFIIEHAAFLALLLVVAASTGTLVMGPRPPLALRSTLGMAVAGQLFILLATIGALRPWNVVTFAAIIIAAAVAPAAHRRFAGDSERRRAGGRPAGPRPALRVVTVAALLTLPLFLLALYPPIAFDETLYHLPFVRAIARSGAIRFLPDVRFSLFPQLHEVLCVPAFLLLGDTATHLVALAELLLLAGILIEWPRQRFAGFLAAALVLGNPIVVQLSTVTYVEAALTLFIAAGFCCLDRNRAAAGFLLGSACSVKYLGWYFGVAALLYLLIFGPNRRRAIPLFLGSFLIAVLPMYGRIVALTGNPFFPFRLKLFGTSPWLPVPDLIAPAARIINALRLFWDVTFVRERLNSQPPYAPLFAVAMLITIIAATRDRRAAFVAALCTGYIAIFTFLPQDARYLMPLLPLVSIVAAITVAPRLQKKQVIALAVLSIAPGMAYAGYRLARQWPVPIRANERQQYLEAHLPEYRAMEHRGEGRIYVCAAEQLKYFGGDDLLGDVTGPFAYKTILGGSLDAEELARNLSRVQIRYLLISRAHCPPPWQRLPAEPRFERVYADDAAELWRVRP